MGIAIRTGSPLSLNLAEPVWKQLAGMTLTPADLTEIDRDYVPGELNFFFPLSPFFRFINFSITRVDMLPITIPETILTKISY